MKTTPATINLRSVAHWRLPKIPVTDSRRATHIFVPGLNPTGSLIYPPLPGELPAYFMVIDNPSDNDAFHRWLDTLTDEDRQKVLDRMELS